MKFRTALLLFIWSLSLAATAQLQPFLLLEKPGKIKSRIRFYPGDEISFRYEGEKHFNTVLLQSVNDSTFIASNSVIRFEEVDAIQLPSGWAKIKAATTMGLLAIPAVLVLSAANNIFNTNESPIIGEEALFVSGGFAALGLAGLLIPNNKKYRLYRNWRLIPVIH